VGGASPLGPDAERLTATYQAAGLGVVAVQTHAGEVEVAR
jgi:hypothetical protein